MPGSGIGQTGETGKSGRPGTKVLLVILGVLVHFKFRIEIVSMQTLFFRQKKSQKHFLNLFAGSEREQRRPWNSWKAGF